MRCNNLLQLSLIGCSIALVPSSRDSGGPRDGYLVEYDDGTALEKCSQDALSTIQTGLDGQGFHCTIVNVHEYDSDLLRGASFSLDCGSGPVGSSRPSLEDIAGVDCIKNAWRFPSPQKRLRNTEVESRNVKPNQEEQQREERSNTYEAIFPRGDDSLRDELRRASHEGTGVLRLHAENVTGAGVRVAILDAAIDVTAPALRETTIVYQANLRTGANTSAGICDPHGTANLEITNAKGDTGYGYIGVAPDADFEALAVTDCLSGVGGLEIVDYFSQLYGTGIDVLSMPNTYDLQFPEAPWPTIIKRLFDNGTFVTLAAGNLGPGLYSLRTPTGEHGGMGIGTYDTSVIPSNTWLGNWTAGEERGPIRYHPADPTDQQRFELPEFINLTIWWPGALDAAALEGPHEVADCRPLPEGATPPSDPESTILLQSRLECWSDPSNSSLDITTKYGIRYVMAYSQNSNVTGFTAGRMGSNNIADGVQAVVSVDFHDATHLVSLIAQHGRVDVSLTGDPAMSHQSLSFTPNHQTGLTPSSWGTWGPTLDSHIGPHVLGPSQYVALPLPARFGNIGIWSGTSFATPYLGGVVALVKSVHQDWSPREIRNAIVATARPVRYQDGEPNFNVQENLLAPVQQQGGGRVDAYAAVRSDTVVDVMDLGFNDTVNRPALLNFSIRNTGAADLSYQLSHQPAGSGYLISPDDPYTFTLKEALPVYAVLDISPSSVSLETGQSTSISVSVRSNPDLPDAEKRVSFFGGYVAIESSAPEANTLTIPYTGFGAPLLNIPNINQEQARLIGNRQPDFAWIEIEGGRLFNATLNASDTSDYPIKYPDNIYPGFLLPQTTASRRIDMSIVNTGTGDAPILNKTIGSSQDPLTDGWFWAGSEYDRTFLPAGTYVWEVFALRLNGDAGNRGHYDFWRSAEWRLVYSPDSIGLPVSA